MNQDYPFLPFCKPCISEDEINEVVDTLRSGWMATGPKVSKFEDQLKNYLNQDYAKAFVHGAGALHVALLAMGVGPGDEVITTSFTFVATYNAIEVTGATLRLVDVDPNTLNMDMDALEAAITPRTKAIVPVHYAGLPVDCDRVYELAERHGLRVLEDAAHAIGASYKGRKIGSFGDTQMFSFHPNKNMTTGEGGAVVTRDVDLAKKIERLRFHGIDRDTFNRFTKAGSQLYDIAMAGFKYNMSDIQAAIGIHQLKKLDQFCQRREYLAKRYLKIMGDWPMFEFPKAPAYDHVHAWDLFTPRIIPEIAGMDRDTFLFKMKEANIGLGLHWGAFHLSTYYRQKYGFKPGDFPHCDKICDTISSFPLFPDLTEADQDRVIETMAHILKV